MSKKELEVPPSVEADANAVEVLRIWVANKKQVVILNPYEWKDPAAWGLLLVDLAKHAARAYHQVHGTDIEIALQRVRQGFDAEWGDPTDNPTGSIG